MIHAFLKPFQWHKIAVFTWEHQQNACMQTLKAAIWPADRDTPLRVLQKMILHPLGPVYSLIELFWDYTKRQKQLQFNLFIVRQIITDIISGHFSYRIGLDQTLYSYYLQRPNISPMRKHLAKEATKNSLLTGRTRHFYKTF